MTAPDSPPRQDGPTRQADLRLTRIAAAALAAVTTAVLGSKLGAEGTLIGAAGASVVTTVATALYQASLERSGERVRTLTHRSRSIPASRRGSTNEHRAAADTQPGEPPWDRPSHAARWRWGAVVLGAFGGFVLAMLAITSFEWASGEAVGGNGRGTTIGQVVTDQSGPQKPAAPPATHSPAAPTSETPTETTEPPPPVTTTPHGGSDNEQSPTTTSEQPTSTETPPPLIRLPGIGG